MRGSAMRPNHQGSGFPSAPTDRRHGRCVTADAELTLMLEAKPAGNGAARWQRRAVYAQPARNFDSSGNGPRQWPQTSDPLTPALGTGTRSASTWRALDAWGIATGGPPFDL